MAYTDTMINITQGELQQLIRQDTRRISKPIQRMIRKHSPQPHRPRMQNRLMTQRAQTRMPMHNLNLLADANIAKDGEEGEHGRKRRVAVDDEEGHVVDLEPVGQIADALAVVVGVGDDDDFVAAVDQLAGDLVDVRFDAAGLREEEVADHGDVVGATTGHGGGWVVK